MKGESCRNEAGTRERVWRCVCFLALMFWVVPASGNDVYTRVDSSYTRLARRQGCWIHANSYEEVCQPFRLTAAPPPTAVLFDFTEIHVKKRAMLTKMPDCSLGSTLRASSVGTPSSGLCWPCYTLSVNNSKIRRTNLLRISNVTS